MAVMNLPNALTTLRLMAAPAIAGCLLFGRYDWALYLFLAAALTDALDGFIARRFDLVTDYGTVTDPLADKLVTLAVVVLLTWEGRLPLWLTLALVVRDTIIVGGAFAYHRAFGVVEIRPTRLGKLHTLAAFLVLSAVLADGAGLVTLTNVLPAGFLLVAATTVASGAQYVVLWGRKAAAERAAK